MKDTTKYENIKTVYSEFANGSLEKKSINLAKNIDKELEKITKCQEILVTYRALASST